MDQFKLAELPNKSLWRERPSQIWSFYCPLCKLPRKLPYRPRPGGVRQVSQIALTTAFLMLVMWPLFSWKGIVLGLPLWIGFEIFYRARIRASVNCPNCGFDPFLYMVDVKRARTEVEAHWRKLFAEKGIPFPDKNAPAAPQKAAKDAEPAAEPAPDKIPEKPGVVS